MSNDPREQNGAEDERSFADILNEFESTTCPADKRSAGGRGKQRGKGRGRGRPAGAPPLRGTVVGISGDFVLVDYGAKSEGVIPRADLLDAEGNLIVQRGETFDVAVTGFDSKGMATLSRVAGPRPRDWDALTRAFENKEIVAGRVMGQVKGGFTVDLGTRAFMPSSRSGVREPAEMEKLVGQEIRVRIIKVDVTDEDVVVDRRAVAEEEERDARERL